MSFDEIMNRFGGHDVYFGAIQTIEGRFGLLALLGVNFGDICRLVDTPGVMLLMTAAVAKDNLNHVMKGLRYGILSASYYNSFILRYKY